MIIKKILTSILLFFFSLSLANAISLNDKTISLEQINSFKKYQFKTDRFKKDKHIVDEWEGILLKDLLNSNQIANYNLLQFNSQDNYMIRLKKADIDTSDVYLAFKRNGTELPENDFRIVSPKMRDMFWISNLKSISVVDEILYKSVNRIIPITTLTSRNPIINDPKPFVKVKGYYLNNLLKNLIKDEQTNIQIITFDHLTQELNYKEYLDQAILVKNDLNYDIKSPSMPGGMWQKDIASLRFNDILIVFNQKETKPNIHDLEKSLNGQVIKKIKVNLLNRKIDIILPEQINNYEWANIVEINLIME